MSSRSLKGIGLGTLPPKELRRALDPDFFNLTGELPTGGGGLSGHMRFFLQGERVGEPMGERDLEVLSLLSSSSATEPEAEGNVTAEEEKAEEDEPGAD